MQCVQPLLILQKRKTNIQSRRTPYAKPYVINALPFRIHTYLDIVDRPGLELILCYFSTHLMERE